MKSIVSLSLSQSLLCYLVDGRRRLFGIAYSGRSAFLCKFPKCFQSSCTHVHGADSDEQSSQGREEKKNNLLFDHNNELHIEMCTFECCVDVRSSVCVCVRVYVCTQMYVHCTGFQFPSIQDSDTNTMANACIQQNQHSMYWNVYKNEYSVQFRAKSRCVQQIHKIDWYIRWIVRNWMIYSYIIIFVSSWMRIAFEPNRFRPTAAARSFVLQQIWCRFWWFFHPRITFSNVIHVGFIQWFFVYFAIDEEKRFCLPACLLACFL